MSFWRVIRRCTVAAIVVLWIASTAGSQPIPGDVDGDGTVGFPDFLILATNFGKSGDPHQPTVVDTIFVVDTLDVYPSGDYAHPTTGPGEISIASFNIRIYSTGSRDDAELGLIADRLEQFDLIAIQELRDQDVVDRTIAILAARGHAYAAIVSDEVGRSSTERYAFFYRPDEVEAIESGAFYDDPGDLFIREPYHARFRAGLFDFRLVTIHAVFGSTKAERRAEAEQLDEVYQAALALGEPDVIVLGDFNLEPEDEAFAVLRTTCFPVVTGDLRTTITEASLFDNVWIPTAAGTEYAGRFGIDRFDQRVFGNDDDAASLAVSDHRPVWAIFSTLEDDD